MSKFVFFYRVLVLTWMAWGLSGCAPSVSPPETAEEEAPAAAPARERRDVVEREAEKPEEAIREMAEAVEETAPVEENAERFDPENPDWDLRLRLLYERYLSEFEAPEMGRVVTVHSAAGRVQRGILVGLSESSVVLDIGAGEVTLHAEHLSEESRAQFFAEDHARLRASRLARAEHEAWRERERRGEAARGPEGGDQGNGSGRRVGEGSGSRGGNGVGDPPRNEGPAGRVWQVDQYIRKNAAIPDSLQIEEWGRVQPHGDGYTVRVRYSLQGADGFGRSNEDMIFFMREDGTVYQRAAYRGN